MYFVIFILFFHSPKDYPSCLLQNGMKTGCSKTGAIEYGKSPLSIYDRYAYAVYNLNHNRILVERLCTDKFGYSCFCFILVLSFKFWAFIIIRKNTGTLKIYRIPGVYPVKKGPLQIFYDIPIIWRVVLEIAIIPLVFHLYYTAIIFYNS